MAFQGRRTRAPDRFDGLGRPSYRNTHMSWQNIKLIFLREVRDQLRDRRTLFMITILPVLLYPMLGLGMVEMMLTFSEQRRTVAILNADDLPVDPAFLNEAGIRHQWLGITDDEPSPFRVVTDLQTPLEEEDDTGGRRGSLSREELLANARTLAERLRTRGDDVSRQDAEDLSTLFNRSGVHALVLVPEGYAASVAQLRNSLQRASRDGVIREGEAPAEPLTRTESREQSSSAGASPSQNPGGSAEASPSQTGFGTSVELPALEIVRNGADDKSVVAFNRVRGALESWEDALRQDLFAHAELPELLQTPARLATVEIARGEQVAANVWSKLFPAMLVIMALTGAFYPAIDLGAGEKERGTMETLLISPARRVELVLGKFATILLFSVASALMNLLSMGLTGQNMASAMGGGVGASVNLEFPPLTSLIWLVVLLIPLAALFSALCLALATFAKSSKEGQYYLTPLLMVVMGLTMFCLSPSVEMTPLYSVLPVINVALLLKGVLLTSAQSGDLLGFAIPVLVSSCGYSMLALWWAIDLYNSEDVLFREAEKFDVRSWVSQLLRTKDAVPVFPEAVFCFILILILQFVAMSQLQPDMNSGDPGRTMMRLIVIQQLTMIACPAIFMGLLLTTSLRATFRLRTPKFSSLLTGVGLAAMAHPVSVELNHFLMSRGVFPELPEAVGRVNQLMMSTEHPSWLLIMVFAVTPAICEELAFRGFILSGLARGGRLAIAIVMSSMMFGIVHLIPQQIFNTALLGLLLGLLAVHSRSLFPAIAFHFCNNAIATFYARSGSGVSPDGVFFSHDGDGQLRYEAPLLILCGVGISILVVRMIRDLIAEQEAKRRGDLQPYVEPSDKDASPVNAAVVVAAE